MPARTASSRTRRARPGTPPSTWAGGCGGAPSSGSTRRSTRASVSPARSASPATSAARPTSSARTILTRACRRTFIRQTIDLGGASEKVEAAANQLAGYADRQPAGVHGRQVLGRGHLRYQQICARCPRPTSSTGRSSTPERSTTPPTPGASPTARRRSGTRAAGRSVAGVFDLSIVPNSTELDPRFEQVQWVGEIERRYELWGQPGKLAVTGFLTRGRMGRFEDAIRLAQLTGVPADIAAVRQISQPHRASASTWSSSSHPISGFFARGGLSSGGVEPYEFTDVDRTVAAGLVLQGKRWGRPDDTIGLAGVINGISGEHEAFLNARRPRHPGGRRQAAQSRHREDHRDLLQPGPDARLAADIRLPVHRQPRLQPRSRPGLGHRHAPTREFLIAADARSAGMRCPSSSRFACNLSSYEGDGGRGFAARQRADADWNRHLALRGRAALRRVARRGGQTSNWQASRLNLGDARRPSLTVAPPSWDPREATRSIRQLEPVALGALLAPRRLGCLRLALATHPRKDDDLCTRCFGAVARLCARVPRTEIEESWPLRPSGRGNMPRHPPSHDAHAISWRITHLNATGVNEIVNVPAIRPRRGQAASQSSRKWRPWRSSTDTIQMSGSNSI